MKNIIIISKVVVNAKPIRVGFDQNINPFKKRLSTSLEASLKESLTKENLEYTVSIDQTYDTCKELIENGADLILISPYVKTMVDLSNLDKNSYYLLSITEFEDSNVDNIINFIKKLN